MKKQIFNKRIYIKLFFILFVLLFFGCSADFLIIGDSMGECVSINGKSKCWKALEDKYIVTNVAKSGYPIKGMIDEFDPFIVPENVIIFMGFNDIKHLDYSIPDIASRYGLLTKKVDSYRSKVFCVGVPPMNHIKSNVWYPEGESIDNNRIKEFNDIVKEICLNKGYIFIDTFTDYVDTENECISEYSEDGIHPSQLLYDDIIDKIMTK